MSRGEWTVRQVAPAEGRVVHMYHVHRTKAHYLCGPWVCMGAGWVCPTPWVQGVHLRCSGQCKKAVLVEADWTYRGDNVN